VARVSGAPNLPGVIRAYGLREIATGVGLLTSKDPSPWLWARVAGDALDVATVGAGMRVARRPLRTLSALALLLGIAYVDAKVAKAAPLGKNNARSPRHDYSSRSGFPAPPAQMRGVGLRPSTRLNGASGAEGAAGNGAFRTSGPARAPAIAQIGGG
jgi:hypothetical protein